MAKLPDLGEWLRWRTRPKTYRPESIQLDSTAPEAYAAMVKHEISPALRPLGLKGSGGRYELPSATHWALVGFQKSRYSDAIEVRFTVNLCAINRQTWETMREESPHIGTRPTPSALYGTWATQTRIGDLLPDGQGDKWWRVTQGEPTAPVAADVLSDLTSFGLPWLRHNVTDLGH